MSKGHFGIKINDFHHSTIVIAALKLSTWDECSLISSLILSCLFVFLANFSIVSSFITSSTISSVSAADPSTSTLFRVFQFFNSDPFSMYWATASIIRDDFCHFCIRWKVRISKLKMKLSDVSPMKMIVYRESLDRWQKTDTVNGSELCFLKLKLFLKGSIISLKRDRDSAVGFWFKVVKISTSVGEIRNFLHKVDTWIWS